MIKRIALLATILISGLSIPAMAADNGVIQGDVVNGSPGGGSVAGLTLTLTSFMNGTPTANTTGKTDGSGRFTFTGLSTTDGNAYDVTLTYKEVDYISEPVALADNETVKATTLDIYEPSGSDADLYISAAHTIVYLAGSNVEVVEYLVFSNSSNFTYIGSGDVTPTGGRKSLKLPLPSDATGLQYGGDLIAGKVLPDTSGLVDTTPIQPGNKLIAYSYVAPAPFATYRFSQAYDYPVTSYNFLVQGENSTAVSSQLSAGQVVDFQGLKFVSLSGGGFKAGSPITVELSGLYQKGKPSGTNRQTTLLVALILVVAIGGGITFIYLFKKRNQEPVKAGLTDEDMKQQLLTDIARLDDDFESGSIEKAVYTRIRAEKKAQLVRLMQSSKGESDSA